MIKAVPRYNRRSNREFSQQLRSRVNAYFEENNIKRTGDWRIAVKALFMFSLYLIPYVVLMTNNMPGWVYILCYILMGFGVAGIGLAIMHDANHGSLSSKKWVNKLFGYSLNIIGGNSLSWKIQHNVLHHSFTNIHGLDEDLEGGHIMRFTPHEPWKKHHKWQHIYAWALYSLMTFSWVAIKDFRRITRYRNLGLLEGQGVSYFSAIATIAVSKVVYIGYMLVLPMYMGYHPLLVLSGFALMHIIGGLLLAMIFQPAHIMEHHMFVPNEVDQLKDCYEAHQLSTTTNFGSKNPVLTWYCGGLNYQVEHHIFPSISHVHYPKISKIIKECAEEYGVPYRSFPTFTEALKIHQRTMKKLGQDEWQDPNQPATAAIAA